MGPTPSQLRTGLLSAILVLSLAACSAGATAAGAGEPLGATKGIPTGFLAVTLAAMGRTHLWLMGRGHCSSAPCLQVWYSSDGGVHFGPLTAPALPVSTTQPSPVLRFANPLDGYAFIPGAKDAFYSTHTGGRRWQREAIGTVLGLVVTAGDAYALLGTNCGARCSGTRLVRSAVGSNRWRSGQIHLATSSLPVEMAAAGPMVWILGGGAAGSPTDELARSSDRGTHFLIGPSPCHSGLPAQLAAASPTALWLLCSGIGAATAWRSASGGRFQRVALPPLAGADELAAASATKAVLAFNGAGVELSHTADGGGVWTPAAIPGGGGTVSYLTLSPSGRGYALVANRQGSSVEVWRSLDDGSTWSRLPIAGGTLRPR